MEGHDAFLDSAPGQQGGPKGAGQQAAVKGGGDQATVLLLHHEVGDGRFGYFPPLVPQDDIVAVGAGLPGLVVEASLRRLVIESGIGGVDGEGGEPQAQGGRR